MPGKTKLTFLTTGVVLMLTTGILNANGIVPEDILSKSMHCTTNANRSVIEVSNEHQEIFLMLNTDFKYLQISLYLSSCYRYSILRGNRYLTANMLNTRNKEEILYVELNHTVITERHCYHINIESETANLTNTINTQTACGKFQGFRVKAVGAIMCVTEPFQLDDENLYQHDGEYTNNTSKLSRSRLIESYSDTDNDYMKNLREITRWATMAYIMAICFAISVYIVFIISSLFESGMIRNILNARVSGPTYAPVNDV